jgi:hypothetical protein
VGISGFSSNIVEKNNCYRARLAGIELSIDRGKPPFGPSNNIIRYNSVHDDGSHGIFTNYVPRQGNKFTTTLSTITLREAASWRITWAMRFSTTPATTEELASTFMSVQPRRKLETSPSKTISLSTVLSTTF